MMSKTLLYQRLSQALNNAGETLIRNEAMAMGETDLLSLILHNRYNWNLHWEIAHPWITDLLGFYYQKFHINYDGIHEQEFVEHYGYTYGDDYFSKNLIRGVYNNIEIESVFVHSTRECEREYQDDDGDWQYENYTQTIFSGTLISLKVPMYFRKNLYLHRGTSTIDHQEFSQTYKIHCDDPIYTRYLLTQNMMEKIIRLTKSLEIVPNIWFNGNHVMIYIQSRNLFGAIDFRDISGSLQRFILDAKLFKTVIDTLNFEEHSIALNEAC